VHIVITTLAELEDKLSFERFALAEAFPLGQLRHSCHRCPRPRVATFCVTKSQEQIGESKARGVLPAERLIIQPSWKL